MNSRIQICTIFFVILLAGCSGSPYENPIGPGLDDVTPQQTTDNTDPLPGNRIVWGIWTVRVSEDHSSIVAARDRSAEMHLNLVRFLEVFPCDDCLSIGNIQVIQPNEISLDLTIRHPFEDNLNLTGFDVRAIFISGADYSFPTMERSIAWGDDLPRLLNPDGYTALFNPTEFPDTDPDPWIFKYTPGMYSTGGDLTATLNPFVAYGTENPRRMFYPGNVETKEIHLHVPSGGFEFGYAIEGSWVDPGKDVILPEIDFPVSASSIEPYMVSVWLGDGLKPVVGSEASIFVEVHDFQGLHTIGDVIVEAPDLLDGTLSLEFDVPTGDESWQYKGTLINESGAGPGTYPILVKVESVQDDPNLGELAAYQLCEVEIPEVLITSITEVTPPWLTSISLKV